MRYLCNLALFLILLNGIQNCSFGEKAMADKSDVVSILLNPQMDAVTTPGVPRLDEKTVDAERIRNSGMAIEPQEQYRWVYEPDENISFKVSGRKGTFILTFWDWESRPVAQSQFIGPATKQFDVKVKGRGTWVVTLDSIEAGECKSRLVKSFSVCPSNVSKRNEWKKSNFWIGQCSFPGWQNAKMEDGHFAYPSGFTADESSDLDADLSVRMGIQIARVDMAVTRRDKEGMDLDFSIADKSIQKFTSRGLKVDLHLFVPYGEGHGPILPKYAAVPLSQVALYPIQEKAYRHYISETVKRYGKYARFIQIRNEPANNQQYLGTPDEFANEIRIAREEIKKLYPNIPVTNGGYCNESPEMQECVKKVKGYTDFVSYHWHGDLTGMKWFFQQISDIHKDAGYENPVYANTEMGYYMPNAGGERINAVYEIQKLLYVMAHKHAGVLLYSSRELWWPRQFGADTGFFVSDYGFVDHFFCPRYVYGAVSAFLDYYAGYQFQNTLKESENLHVYTFRKGKKQLLAFFAIHKPTAFKIDTDGKNIQLIDPMGNASKVSSNGIITLDAGEYPKSLIIENASYVKIVD